MASLPPVDRLYPAGRCGPTTGQAPSARVTCIPHLIHRPATVRPRSIRTATRTRTGDRPPARFRFEVQRTLARPRRNCHTWSAIPPFRAMKSSRRDYPADVRYESADHAGMRRSRRPDRSLYFPLCGQAGAGCHAVNGEPDARHRVGRSTGRVSTEGNRRTGRSPATRLRPAGRSLVDRASGWPTSWAPARHHKEKP